MENPRRGRGCLHGRLRSFRRLRLCREKRLKWLRQRDGRPVRSIPRTWQRRGSRGHGCARKHFGGSVKASR
eukprot:3553321-Lingulodinium_polyedra.AAC.1